ncbi:MAG: CBO0543 family protein [Syntrophomonadaceae bacterium]|nr:CBO0543 family protein [Syntrophomonadaceae bacterium]
MKYFSNMNPDEIQLVLWAVLILPWVLFFIFVDWNKIKTLHSVGLLTALLAMIGDSIGSSLHLWIYPAELLPVFYNFFPVNLSLLPVENMLIVQFMPPKTIKKIALILCVGLFNMVIEYLFEGNTAAIFYPHWKPIYSLPFYLGLFSLGYFYHKWLTSDKIKLDIN